MKIIHTQALPALVAACFVAACGNTPTQSSSPPEDAGIVLPPDAGRPCDNPCGQLCCNDGEMCRDGQCVCRPACEQRQCGPDGCGGSCGTCDDHFTCNETSGTCLCVPETLEELCAGRCGTRTATDRCGNPHTDLDCGGCQAPEECDEPTHTCVCVPESDSELCGTKCGLVNVTDRCGTERLGLDCGGCADPLSCNTATHACECVAESDAAFCAKAGISRQCGPATGLDRCGNAKAVAECGPCASPLLCDERVGRCVTCLPTTEQVWCQAHERNCGTLQGIDSCGNAASFNCGTCTAPEVCGANNICATPGQAKNDGCANAELVLFQPDGSATLNLDTSIAADSGSGSCLRETGGSDVVYRIHLTDSMNLTAVATPAASRVVPSLYLRSDCALGSSEISCVEAVAPGSATLIAQVLPPGDYYLWADSPSANSGSGAVTVVLTLSAPGTAPANDECPAAEPLTATGGVASAAGTTNGAHHDSAGSCSAMTGGDVFYALHLDAQASVLAKVARNAATSPDFQPAVYILGGCASGALELACGVAGASSTPAVAFTNALVPAGDYLVVVDGTNGTRGDFTLEVTLGTSLASNDTCALPRDLTFNASKVATLSDDTTLGADGIVSSCNGTGTGTDLVYRFVVPPAAAQDVSIVVAPKSGSALKPNPSVRRSCADKASEVGCVAVSALNTPAKLRLKSLAPDTYWLWVDGWLGTSNGPFDLTVSLADVPPAPGNDLCVGAETVAIDVQSGRGAATFGTTLGATHDTTGTCTKMTGGDAVYSFHLNAAAAVTAKVIRQASTPDWIPAVYISSDCANSAELGCGYGTAGDGTATAIAPNLPVGDYYVHVDGVAATDGNFELQLAVAPAQTNGTCSTATPITLDLSGHATVTGLTSGMGSDTSSPGCASSGPDVVYSITLSERKNLRFRLTPIAFTGDSVLHLRSACADETTEKRCNRAAQGTLNELVATNLTVGIPYYLWVDGYSSAHGAFTLDVDALTPQPPDNDTCAGATVIPIDPVASGSVTLQSTTLDALGDRTGSCRTDVVDPSGAEVVFTFTLGGDKKVDLEVLPATNSPLKPVLFVQYGQCGTGSELACRAVSASNTAARVVLPHAPAGTYFVWVDGYAPGATGDFSLTLTTSTPPTSLANDSCRSTPEAMVWDATAEKFTATGTTVDAFNDYQGSCAALAPQTGGDVVYTFTPATRCSATLKITRTSGTSNSSYVPAMYLRSTCDGTGAADELGCAFAGTSSSASFDVPSLNAGQPYFLVVDGAYGSAGAFTVEVQTRAPIPDTCALAEVLPIASGTALQVTGDTTYASDDAGNLGCVGNGQTGRDVVYAFSTRGMGRQKLTATVTYSASLTYPALSLRSVCTGATAADEVACIRRETSGALTLNANLEMERTYYLWVDHASTTHKSPFTLDLLLEPLLTPPSNDTCGATDALGVLATPDTVTRTGTTAAAANDYLRSCDGVATDGPDVVYSFTLAQESQVIAKLTRDAAATNYNPAVYIRRACDNALASDEVACGTSTSATAARAAAWRLAAGNYFVVVDGRGGTGGAFTLQVTTAAPRDYPDSCLWAKPLALDANGHVQLTDTTVDASADAAPPSCVGSTSSASGADLVYVLDTTSLGARDLSASVQYATSSVYPAIYLRTACDSNAEADQVVCARRNTSSGGALVLNKPNLPAGIYYLWVDTNYATDTGSFTLTVDLLAPTLPPTNSTCATAQELSLTTGAAVVSGGSTILGDNDTSITCGTKQTDGADVFYTFTLAQAANVYAAVARTSATPTYEPTLAIRRYCAPTGTDEFGCSVHTSGVAKLSVQLPAGSYYLIVDGTGGTSGKFDLQLAVLEDTLSDTCATARALALDGRGKAVVRVDTANATANDTGGSCSNHSSGKDLVYTVQVLAGQTKNLIVEASPLLGSTYRPVVSVRSNCTTRTAPSELACDYNASAGATATAKALRLTEGTYYVWLDSYAVTAGSSPPVTSIYNGPVEMRVSLVDTPPPPPNDTCTAPTVLQFTGHKATVAGEVLEDGVNNGTGTCANMAGPDRVYELTIQDPKAIYAVVRPSPNLYPTVYIRRAQCDSSAGTDEVACKAISTSLKGYPVSTAVRQALPGTYWIWVDSLATNNLGTYTLDVFVEEPQDNESCSVAQIPALSKGVSVAGTNEGGTNDFASPLASGACGGRSAPGAEVVYSYTPTASGPFEVKVFAHAFNVFVWISEGTCNSACVAYNDSGGGWEGYGGTSGATDTLTYNGVAGTTYYIVVDNTSSSAAYPGGLFEIVVN